MSPFYRYTNITTNKDIRYITTLFPNAKRILTVTGNGDTAIFFRLNGADIVDTYDMSTNARAIQEIKTTAIRHLTHQEYKTMINNLCKQNCKMSYMPTIRSIQPYLSQETKQIINKQNKHTIFQYGTVRQENLPTDKEYEKLHTLIKKPFSFTESYLENIHNTTSQQYDLIYVSDIMDYTSPAIQSYILSNLANILNINGYIIHTPEIDTKKTIPTEYNSKNGNKFEYLGDKKQGTTILRIFQLVATQKTK